jgi:hypothetical protein
VLDAFRQHLLSIERDAVMGGQRIVTMTSLLARLEPFPAQLFALHADVCQSPLESDTMKWWMEFASEKYLRTGSPNLRSMYLK